MQAVTDGEARAAPRGAGQPDKAVEGVVGMTRGPRDGFTPEQPRTGVTTPPTTLGAWAYEHLRPVVTG